MRAKLKSLYMHLPDAERVSNDGTVTAYVPSPEEFTPPDSANFAYHAQVFIGSADSERSDSFDVLVCTPRWLAENFQSPMVQRWKRYESENLLYGNGLVLMETWDAEELRRSIEWICADTVGPSWGPIANRIGQWLPWEFQYTFDEELGLDEVRDPPGSWKRDRDGSWVEDTDS